MTSEDNKKKLIVPLLSNTWFVCVESRKRAAPRWRGGCRRHWGVLHIKAASPLLGVISERWILIGRKGVAFALYGYEQNKMIFFSLSVWFIVHSVSENTRRKCMCVWHKGGSKDKISELMIKREAAIRTVTLLPLKKKNEIHTGQKGVCRKRKKKIPPGYTTYSMCTVVLCLLPHLPQVIKYTSNRVITGPVCCL